MGHNGIIAAARQRGPGAVVESWTFSEIGQASSGAACGETADTTRYITDSIDWDNGSVVYTDAEGYNVFDGGGDWFNVDDFEVFTVSSSGVIGNLDIC